MWPNLLYLPKMNFRRSTTAWRINKYIIHISFLLLCTFCLKQISLSFTNGRYVQKVSWLKLYLPRQWNVKFIQNSPLGIQQSFPSEFSIDQISLFLYVLQLRCISFNVFHTLKSLTLVMSFQLRKKILRNLLWRMIHLHNPEFYPKLVIKQYGDAH